MSKSQPVFRNVSFTQIIRFVLSIYSVTILKDSISMSTERNIFLKILQSQIYGYMVISLSKCLDIKSFLYYLPILYKHTINVNFVQYGGVIKFRNPYDLLWYVYIILYISTK